MYHGQLLFRDHGQTPLPQHCQPWSNVVGNEKQWYHGHPVAGVFSDRHPEKEVRPDFAFKIYRSIIIFNYNI